jgi:hypothetical protein
MVVNYTDYGSYRVTEYDYGTDYGCYRITEYDYGCSELLNTIMVVTECCRVRILETLRAKYQVVSGVPL